jgi:very-short-patch-repair endonuclease
MRAHTNPKRKVVLEDRAQAMRAAPSWSEAALWRCLKASQLGTRFIRQAPLGRFVVDFLAPAARLAVEVDGPYHARRATADARRDRVLRRLGYRVLRVSEEAVRRELSLVLERIRRALGAPG